MTRKALMIVYLAEMRCDVRRLRDAQIPRCNEAWFAYRAAVLLDILNEELAKIEGENHEN